MWTPEVVAIVVAVFLLAGLVKGAVGFGLPTVALALLTATLGLKAAMALMLVPSFVTNVWQGLSGGAFVALLRRFWPLLLAVVVGVWFGAGVLARSDVRLLSALLGVLLCLYAIFSLVAPRLPSPGARETWISPLIGLVNGFVTGLTGSFVVPAVPYMQILGLPGERLVQAMGILFTVSTLALAGALGGRGLLPAELGGLSVLALVPALFGMWLGRRLRQRLSDQRFRQVFLVALLLLGVYIVVRALG